MIRVTVTGRTASATSDEPITTGSVGIPVAFELSEDFAELAAVATFACGPRRADVALVGSPVTVPAQLLRHGGHRLSVGVLGAAPDGTVVIPTIWADVGVVRPGAEPSGIDPAQPTPSWAAQVQEAAASAVDAVTSVSEAAARGDFDGFTPTATVERTEGGATITITDKDGTTTAEVFDGQDAADNLTPFFSRQPTGESPDPYWYWHHSWQSAEYLGGGWMRAECNNDIMGSAAMYTYVPRRIEGLRAGARYTLLVEVRNLDHGAIEGGEHEPSDRNPFIQVGYNDYDYQLNVASYAKQEQPITGDGHYLYEVYAADNIASSSRDKLVRCNVFAPPYQHVSVEVRISLWEGDYDGPWKPCPWWLSDEVEELSDTITTLGETVGGVSSDVSTLTETATALTDGLTEVSGSIKHLGDNLSPFFEHARDTGDGRYWQQLDSPWTILEDGWARFEYDNNGLSDRASVVRPAPIDQFRRASLVPGNRYTLLVETRSYEHSGEHAELYVQSEPDSYMPSPDLLAVWNGSGDDFYTELRNGDGVMYYVEMFATDSESATETLLNLYVRVPQYSSASFEMRLSLFEGEYNGPWKPCVWWFKGSMAETISANMAPEDVASDITMNADLHIYQVRDKLAKRACGIVTVGINILLNQEVVVGHERSDRSVVVATLSGRATPPDPSNGRGPEYTYLSTNIPGIKAFVNGREGTIELGADDPTKDVVLGTDYYRNRVIISGSYLAQ